MRFKLFEFSCADLFLENSQDRTTDFLSLFELISIFNDPVHGYHTLSWAVQYVLNATQMIHLRFPALQLRSSTIHLVTFTAIAPHVLLQLRDHQSDNRDILRFRG